MAGGRHAGQQDGQHAENARHARWATASHSSCQHI